MKKLFACIFAIIILAINILPCYAVGPALSISSNDYTLSAGDVVTVSVSLSSGSNLGTLTFEIRYNPSQFEYVAGSATTNDVFEMSEVNVATSGAVSYTCISTEVATAGGTVGTARFRALTEGGKISVVVREATDGEYAPVRVSTSSITLSCNHAKMIWEDETPATCTAKGTERGTCTCGYTTVRETERAAHTYNTSTIKKEATCTQTGIEVGTCTVCGASGVESKIPAKGHDYTEWVVTQEPTADTMGIKARSCRNCGETKTQMIPTLIEGISPEDQTGESSTESTTEFKPIEIPEPSTDDFYEIPTETTTHSNGIFGNAVGSDIAIIVVIALAVLVLIILVLYISLIIKQKKK